MKLEVNGTFAEKSPALRAPDGTTLLLTPPINKDYWLARVPVSERQAVVCFPKFGTIGIGFQVEDDWNTNLPYTSSAEEIFDHIAHNKGDTAIADADCIEAIRVLQAFIRQL